MDQNSTPEGYVLEDVNFAVLRPWTDEGRLLNRVLYARERPELLGQTWGYLLAKMFART